MFQELLNDLAKSWKLSWENLFTLLQQTFQILFMLSMIHDITVTFNIFTILVGYIQRYFEQRKEDDCLSFSLQVYLYGEKTTYELELKFQHKTVEGNKFLTL